MKTIKRVEYSNFSDQTLLSLFEQHRDRLALCELYERYRKPIGQFLHRKIKDKNAIAAVFNAVLMRLIAEPFVPGEKPDLATRLFAIAYELRAEYSDELDRIDAQKPSQEVAVKGRGSGALDALPRTHKDILELVYQHNFTFDQTAIILGCSPALVRNRWSEAKYTQQLVPC